MQLFSRLLTLLTIANVLATARDNCGGWLFGHTCKDDHDCCPDSSWYCNECDKKCVWNGATVCRFTCENYTDLVKWMVNKVTSIGCDGVAKATCPVVLGAAIAGGCEVIGFGPEDPLTWVCTGAGEAAVLAACSLACSKTLIAAENALLEQMAPQCDPITGSSTSLMERLQSRISDQQGTVKFSEDRCGAEGELSNFGAPWGEVLVEEPCGCAFYCRASSHPGYWRFEMENHECQCLSQGSAMIAEGTGIWIGKL